MNSKSKFNHIASIGLLFLLGIGYVAGAEGKSAHVEIASLSTQVAALEEKVSISKVDMAALKTIDPEFAKNYLVSSLSLIFSAPNLLRIDGHSSVFGDAVLIQRGTVQFYELSRVHLTRTSNLQDSPSRLQSLLEYCGILIPSQLQYLDASFVRYENLDGRACSVFDLRYIGHPHASHYRVWIDTETHCTLKRAWYDSNNRLKAIFRYSDAVQTPQGFWLPQRIEVLTAAGKTAAVSTVSAYHVPSSINQAVFETPSSGAKAGG